MKSTSSRSRSPSSISSFGGKQGASGRFQSWTFAVGAAKKEWDPRCFEAPDESKIRPLSLGIMLHDHTVV